MRGLQRDRGAASVLAVGAIALLVALTAGALTVASVVAASHQARLAADLAAIAAAMELQRGSPDSACERGTVTAAHNNARLSDCSVQGMSVTVGVEVRSARWPAPAVARARAGPQGG